MSLQTLYQHELKPKLAQEGGIKNLLAVPTVTKVVIDIGVGGAADTPQTVEQVSRDLALITGQKPQVRKAKLAIAGFNLRKGDTVGLRVTLRGARMYAFLERLFKVVLPRVRDFRGVATRSFDRSGNYSLGLAEYAIFPEIDSPRGGKSWGLGITIVTTAKTDEEAKKLLEELGMPFEKS